MNQPILQLDECIDEQLGIADPASSENVRVLRSVAEFEHIVEALATDAKSLPAFSNKQAIRSQVLAQVAVTAAPRPLRRPARRRSRLVALGAVCALLSTTTAAFAGVLPEPLQNLVARAAQQVGVNLPDHVRDASPAKRTEATPLMSPTPAAQVPESIKQSRDLTPRTPAPTPVRPRPVTPPPTRSQATDLREAGDSDAPDTETDAVEIKDERPEQPEAAEPAEPEVPEVPEAPEVEEAPEVQEAPEAREPETDGDD
ncbi:MAG: hypothetical protein JWO69_666 [Thermoleophilia bacterium]|nr:hypothetical protein [Thermoleophilia bacterium]